MISDERILIEKIKQFDYERMLRLWRFTKSGSEESKMFHGEVGKFFISRMALLRSRLTEAQQEAISKHVGW